MDTKADLKSSKNSFVQQFLVNVIIFFKGWQVPKVCVEGDGAHVHRGAKGVGEPADGQPGEHARVQGRRVQTAEAEERTQHLHHGHGPGGREHTV